MHQCGIAYLKAPLHIEMCLVSIGSMVSCWPSLFGLVFQSGYNISCACIIIHATIHPHTHIYIYTFFLFFKNIHICINYIQTHSKHIYNILVQSIKPSLTFSNIPTKMVNHLSLSLCLSLSNNICLTWY